MKSAGLFIIVFAFSMGLCFLLLRPQVAPQNDIPFNAKPPEQDTPERGEIESSRNVSFNKHTVALIQEWSGGSSFSNPDEKTSWRSGYDAGEGTLVILSFHEHVVGTFDGNSSTTFHFQLPEQITEGATCEFTPVETPDTESPLPIGKMHAFRSGNPFYARSVTPSELVEPATIQILKISPNAVRFKLSVGAVDWLDELPIDDVLDGAIAR